MRIRTNCAICVLASAVSALLAVWTCPHERPHLDWNLCFTIGVFLTVAGYFIARMVARILEERNE